VAVLAPARPPRLSYGASSAATTSALAWLGLGFAALGALAVATQVMIVLGEAGGPGRFSLVVRLEYLLLPLLGILLASLGWRSRANRWPSAAVSIAVLSILTLLLLGSRTWGKPPPAGYSPWQWPRIEWRQTTQHRGAQV